MIDMATRNNISMAHAIGSELCHAWGREGMTVLQDIRHFRFYK